MLNRGHKTDIGPQEAERILECPVAMTFPNDYKAVRRSTTDASCVDKRSDLGEAYLAFSRKLFRSQWMSQPNAKRTAAQISVIRRELR